MIDESQFPCWVDNGYNLPEYLRGSDHFENHPHMPRTDRLTDADVERIAEAVLQKMLEREQVRAFADAGLTAADVERWTPAYIAHLKTLSANVVYDSAPAYEPSPADLEALRRMDGT